MIFQLDIMLTGPKFVHTKDQQPYKWIVRNPHWSQCGSGSFRMCQTIEAKLIQKKGITEQIYRICGLGPISCLTHSQKTNTEPRNEQHLNCNPQQCPSRTHRDDSKLSPNTPENIKTNPVVPFIPRKERNTILLFIIFESNANIRCLMVIRTMGNNKR